MRILIIIGVVISFWSCRKTEQYVPANMYYSYYPTEVNSWIEYEAEEVFHTSFGSDTIRYFLKEIITEDFTDNQGRNTQRIERFWKDSLSGNYSLKDVWYSNVTNTTAEKVEENIRFTKLIFPISDSKSWDGNALNTIGTWEYELDSIHTEKTINSLYFDSTITVLQIDNINPFQYQVASETYANHVGLIQKDYINIDNEEGSELRLYVISYGQ
ncbi:MAG: hypothetical protein ACI9N1_002416 [Flavobacteriales bacterium]